MAICSRMPMPCSTSPSGRGVGGVARSPGCAGWRRSHGSSTGSADPLAGRPPISPFHVPWPNSGGRSRCRASGTRSAASSATVCDAAVPVDQVVLEVLVAHRVPGRHSIAPVDGAGDHRRRRRRPGATAPTSCHRRPSPYSLSRSGWSRVGKLTGAHSQKNCGSPTGAPECGGLADRADAPRAVARPPTCRSGSTSMRVAVDLDPAGPRAELGEARVVEEHPVAVALEEVRLLEAGERATNVSSARRPVLGRRRRDTRSACSGSTTSTRIGPTLVASRRSSGARPRSEHADSARRRARR